MPPEVYGDLNVGIVTPMALPPKHTDKRDRDPVDSFQMQEDLVTTLKKELPSYMHAVIPHFGDRGYFSKTHLHRLLSDKLHDFPVSPGALIALRAELLLIKERLFPKPPSKQRTSKKKKKKDDEAEEDSRVQKKKKKKDDEAEEDSRVQKKKKKKDDEAEEDSRVQKKNNTNTNLAAGETRVQLNIFQMAKSGGQATSTANNVTVPVRTKIINPPTPDSDSSDSDSSDSDSSDSDSSGSDSSDSDSSSDTSGTESDE